MNYIRIWRMLGAQTRFITLGELIANSRINKATVFRILRHLVDEGLVVIRTAPTGHALYGMADLKLGMPTEQQILASPMYWKVPAAELKPVDTRAPAAAVDPTVDYARVYKDNVNLLHKWSINPWEPKILKMLNALPLHLAELLIKGDYVSDTGEALETLKYQLQEILNVVNHVQSLPVDHVPEPTQEIKEAAQLVVNNH